MVNFQYVSVTGQRSDIGMHDRKSIALTREITYNQRMDN